MTLDNYQAMVTSSCFSSSCFSRSVSLVGLEAHMKDTRVYLAKHINTAGRHCLDLKEIHEIHSDMYFCVSFNCT